MDTIVQRKSVQMPSEKAISVINEDNERAFDFKNEGDGIFLYVKCYCSRKQRNGKNYKIVKICLTDVIQQVWEHISNHEKKILYKIIMDVIAN